MPPKPQTQLKQKKPNRSTSPLHWKSMNGSAQIQRMCSIPQILASFTMPPGTKPYFMNEMVWENANWHKPKLCSVARYVVKLYVVLKKQMSQGLGHTGFTNTITVGFTEILPSFKVFWYIKKWTGITDVPSTAQYQHVIRHLCWTPSFLQCNLYHVFINVKHTHLDFTRSSGDTQASLEIILFLPQLQCSGRDGCCLRDFT